MDFLKRYKKMISLRGLTDHTMKSYCTYISAYLNYIQNILGKCPSQVTYKEQWLFPTAGFFPWMNSRFLSQPGEGNPVNPAG